ncbi:TonB-dependent siderophore receptor [Oceanobacter kriegii]|uniref:TonB-dependent siderophore receptor n=1 Tax=Oceanobacter kriegii TaxID=64972 RepID=UPI00040F41DA|nr:TonB-dependent receptor [Oceanobacter kriegii]
MQRPVYAQRQLLSLAISAALLSPVAVSSLPANAAAASPASASTQSINIAAQPLDQALNQLAIQTRTQISASSVDLPSVQAPAIQGNYSVEQALQTLLQDTELTVRKVGNNSYVVEAPVQPYSYVDQPLEEVFAVGGYIEREQLDTATGLGLKPIETPQSVTVFTAQRLKDQQLETIQDVISSTIGLTSTDTDTVRNTFSSRGFEVSNYQVDGLPLSWSLGGDSGETIADVSMYERVEFVRGATGLLTGAGNPSASINFVRKHADSDEFHATIDASVGSWNKKEVSVDVGGGLNESGSIRGRLVAKRGSKDSWQDLYHEDRTVLYGTAEADISDSTLVRIGASMDHHEPTGVTWGALPSNFSDGSQTDWDRSKTTSADWTKWETKGTNLFLNVEHTLDNGWLVKANANRLIYDKDTKLLYLYGSLDKETGTGLVTSPINSYGYSRLDTVNLQLQGDFELGGNYHEFTMGIQRSIQKAQTWEYDEPEDTPTTGNFYEWDGNVTEPDWADTATEKLNMRTIQTGAYAAVRFNITDEWKTIVGGRIASWNRSGNSWGADTNFGDNGVFIPYAGVLYDLNEQHRLYASYTTIFMPQNAFEANGDQLDPLEGSNKEIGLKSSWLNDQLHTTITAFRIDQDNLAQDLTDESGGIVYINGDTDRGQASYSADGTVTQGYELEVVGDLSESWKLHTGYTHFTAEDKDGGDVNSNQARETFNLFTTYEMADLTVGGGVDWQGRTYNGDLEQEAYALVNLMARYQITPQFSTQFNVANLTDKKYFSQVGSGIYRYGAPRKLNLAVSYSF